MHIYKYVQSHIIIIIIHQHVSATSLTIIIRVSYNNITSIAPKCSKNHFISKKYKNVPSFKLHFLPNISLV